MCGGANVRWAPDGEELLFDGGAGTMWSVELVAGVAHGRDAYREPGRLFAQNDAATNFDPGGARGWDVGPGGETFITLQRYAEGISPVKVIENFPRWFRERPRQATRRVFCLRVRSGGTPHRWISGGCVFRLIPITHVG